MKGIILAGGFGKRMLESTRVINKHLLPVYSNTQGAIPMIFFPINTLLKSGIKNILIITSDEAAGMMVEMLGDGKKFGKDVDFTYKIQNMHDPNRPCGIASALKLSKEFVGNNPFAVVLGDNMYADSFDKEFKDFEWKYRTEPEKDFAHVFLKEVVDPERFGIAELDEHRNVIGIVEKPSHPKSCLAVTGLYLFTDHVFGLLPNLHVSARGELEVSHVNDWYVKNGTIKSTVVDGFWSDMGIPTSMNSTIQYVNYNNYLLPHGCNP